ncbi:MAG: right-handed parallel beta-helix repeat-containing protein [Phycisphaerales bacterium]
MKTLLSLALGSLMFTAAGSLAGTLAPPAGPVAPTPGPEPRKAVNATNTPGDASDQFKITQPGSYFLDSNIKIAEGKTWGLAVLAPAVTLDLNGFTIDGNNVGQNGGIRVDAASVLIRNGTIRNVYLNGLAATNFLGGSPGMTVENIRVLDVTGPSSFLSQTVGIRTGRGAIVRDCYVNNAPAGIVTGFNANVSGCTVEFARKGGIYIEGGATVSDCVVVGTAGGPAEGYAFYLGDGSSMKNCVARSNSGDGFFADGKETALIGCLSSNNAGAGFVFGSDTRMDGCHATRNAGPAVVASSGGADDWEITRCTLTNNGAGIVLQESNFGLITRGRIHDCAIRGQGTASSTSVGIRLSAACRDIVITDNVFSNLNRGVSLDGEACRVTNNSFNGVLTPISRSDGSATLVSNFIGPMLTASDAGTATNPFANTSQ